jgi:hypothetical protein
MIQWFTRNKNAPCQALISFDFTYKQIQQHHRRDDEEVELPHELLLRDMVDLERLWIIVVFFRVFGGRNITRAQTSLFGDHARAVGGDGGFAVCRRRRHSFCSLQLREWREKGILDDDSFTSTKTDN